MSHYQIRVLEVGYDTAFPLGIAFDMWNHAGEQAYSPFCMTLIQGENHNILFDCGVDPEDEFCAAKIKMENDQNCHNPADVLNSVGVDPKDIDTVVLSHCHWDHICGMNFLPNATFYVQKKELENWDRVMPDPDFPITHKMVVSSASLEILHNLEKNGRLKLFDGDTEFLPGISVVSAAGHSFAQNMLFIDTDGAHYAVIGDVCMRPESFVGTDIFPCFLPNLKFMVGTIEDISKSYRKILNWVGNDLTHIIMTHDGTRQDTHPTKRSSIGLNVTEIC